MAGPTIVGSPPSSPTQGGASSIVLNVPSGVANGDFLVAIIECISGGSVTTPSGWTAALSYTTNTPNLYVLTRVAGSSEPSTYSFTNTDGTSTYGVILAIRSSANAIENSSFANATTNTPQATGFTTPGANRLLLVVYAITNTSGWFTTGYPPTNWTEEDGTGLSGVPLFVASLLQTAVGATGNVMGGNLKVSSATTSSLLSFAPAASPPPPPPPPPSQTGVLRRCVALAGLMT